MLKRSRERCNHSDRYPAISDRSGFSDDVEMCAGCVTDSDATAKTSLTLWNSSPSPLGEGQRPTRRRSVHLSTHSTGLLSRHGERSSAIIAFFTSTPTTTNTTNNTTTTTYKYITVHLANKSIVKKSILFGVFLILMRASFRT